MAFYGDDMFFDGISCKEYGLILVDKIDTKEQDGDDIGGEISVLEDTVLRRSTPIHYGIQLAPPLEFKLILSVQDSNTYLSKQDIAAIAGWLYGHQDYRRLTILQDDMVDYYYKCIVTHIKGVNIGSRTAGVEVYVRCDASYGYFDMPNTVIKSANSISYNYHNFSNINQYYKPTIDIMASGSTSVISILNQSIGIEFEITDIPASGATIHIDCQRQILSSAEMTDVYAHCNLIFPAFVKGSNNLLITGDCTINIHNNFPMIIGS